MVDQQQVRLRDTAQKLAQCLEQVLSALVGHATVAFQNPNGADALAALPGPLLALNFRLSRKIEGSGSLVLPGSAGLTLARMVLGEEGPSPSTTPSPDEEDALRELANQVSGALASTLTVILQGQVGAEEPLAAWIAAGGREVADGAESTVLTFSISAGTVDVTAYLRLPRSVLPAETPVPAGPALPSLPEATGRKNGNSMELLLDISLALTVELGRTRMMIRDILHLAPGSILELDKLAGEPVDILINDKTIARGEVVVIDDKFGVRLSSIVTPGERLMNLQ